MSNLGNDTGRAVFEHSLPSTIARPAPTAERAVREKWIRDKYQHTFYVEPQPENGEPNEVRFLRAVRQSDYAAMLWCIAHKVDINFHDPDENSVSALHIAVLVRSRTCTEQWQNSLSVVAPADRMSPTQNQNAPIVELLLLNGADADSRDSDAWTPLHHCACHDFVNCAVVLIRYNAKLDRRDFDNKVRR